MEEMRNNANNNQKNDTNTNKNTNTNTNTNTNINTNTNATNATPPTAEDSDDTDYENDEEDDDDDYGQVMDVMDTTRTKRKSNRQRTSSLDSIGYGSDRTFPTSSNIHRLRVLACLVSTDERLVLMTILLLRSIIDQMENSFLCNVGTYKSDAGANVAVIIVKVIFISAFLFYCLLYNHSFQTNPNSVY